MKIHQITKNEEKIAAGLISAVAFHERVDNLEKQKKEWIKNEDEDWGAFTDDDELQARIINNHFYCNFDGNQVMCGGIGAVSTLPEFRNTGAIRQIFENLLPAARKRGELLSALYPFSHAFYRKFGYETITYKIEYEFNPEELKGHKHNGWSKLWKPGEKFSDFTKIYSAFIQNYNLSILRDNNKMKSEIIKEEYYKDRRFCYLLGDDSGSSAYVVFQDKNGTLFVNEAAWINKNGFESVLGFLGRFSADYGNIILPLPTNIDLRHFVSNPYNVQLHSVVNYMVRVMNTEKILELLKKPENCSFTIKIYGDEQIPENNGLWTITDSTVKKITNSKANNSEDEIPDFEMSAKAFSQGIAGGTEAAELELRPDVTVNNNKALFEKIFVRKSIYVGDHF